VKQGREKKSYVVRGWNTRREQSGNWPLGQILTLDGGWVCMVEGIGGVREVLVS
jgi:hypothetical protein